jgi:hypothetical protein
MPNSPRMNWPYPTETQKDWYLAFEALVAAMDASAFASREDRQLILAGGGTVTWLTASSTLAWGDDLKIVSPITGFQVVIEDASVTISDGQVLYAVLTRAPTDNVIATPVVAGQVPSTDTALILAARVGDKIYWRNGLMMVNGDSFTDIGASQGGGGGAPLVTLDEGGLIEPDTRLYDFVGAGVTAVSTGPNAVQVTIPAGGPDLRTAALIIGNQLSGDTLNTCDYLDSGNGAELKTRIEAAGSGTDVYVRPGTYDYNNPGGPTGRITIPVGVRVRGAGRAHVTVRSYLLEPVAFVVSPFALLEELACVAPDDFIGGSVQSVLAGGIVLAIPPLSEVRRVSATCENNWSSWFAPNLRMNGAFMVGPGAGPAVFEDCAGLGLPAALLGGAPQPFSGLDVSGGDNTLITRVIMEGGDFGLFGQARLSLLQSDLFVPEGSAIIQMLPGAAQSEIVDNRLVCDGYMGAVGIALSGADRVGVADNWIEATSGSSGATAILCNADYCSIRGNRGVGDNGGGGGWQVAVSLGVGDDYNIVTGNNFMDPLPAPIPYNDAGFSNDLAHNL